MELTRAVGVLIIVTVLHAAIGVQIPAMWVTYVKTLTSSTSADRWR